MQYNSSELLIALLLIAGLLTIASALAQYLVPLIEHLVQTAPNSISEANKESLTEAASALAFLGLLAAGAGWVVGGIAAWIEHRNSESKLESLKISFDNQICKLNEEIQKLKTSTNKIA